MTGASRLPSTVIAAAALLVGALLLTGPGAARADAACKGANKPAFKLSGKRARKATLCLINKQRKRRGMPKLKEQKHQRKAAKKHTRRMLRKDCFSHRCPGEGDLVSRISSTSYLPCNCYWGVAENLAYGRGRQSRPKRIVKAWMNSKGHRKNILTRRYEHIGIGIKKGTPAGDGRGATYTTTFGYRD